MHVDSGVFFSIGLVDDENVDDSDPDLLPRPRIDREGKNRYRGVENGIYPGGRWSLQAGQDGVKSAAGAGPHSPLRRP
jgi:hypothetical protein